MFNKDEENNSSISSGPLNPNLAEKSIKDIIQARKESLARRLTMIQRNSVVQNPTTVSDISGISKSRHQQSRESVKLNIKSNIIAHHMDKF